ncbi:MAG: hypothetical protein IJ017_04510 [Oscillospiraceae bacterium]|nr:hypothetical protein [Oscillospiraceae bacterium]
MKMCDRCKVPGCLLNYNGKACEKAREEYCPEVVYTNADRIREMSDEELAAFLAKFDPHCCNCPVDTVCGGCSSTPPRDCAYWFEEWLQLPAEERE